jgi:large subunit ribosomal protein L15
MKLCDLKPARGSRKAPTRKGRGPGSGLGKTAGRGSKGQKSRSGYSSRRGFEGGQMPLSRRVPKRGFANPGRVEFSRVNVDQLARFEPNTEVTPELLRQQGIVKKMRDGIKILGRGEIERPLIVHAHRFSAEAKRKIEAAGGKAEQLVKK